MGSADETPKNRGGRRGKRGANTAYDGKKGAIYRRGGGDDGVRGEGGEGTAVVGGAVVVSEREKVSGLRQSRARVISR